MPDPFNLYCGNFMSMNIDYSITRDAPSRDQYVVVSYRGNPRSRMLRYDLIYVGAGTNNRFVIDVAMPVPALAIYIRPIQDMICHLAEQNMYITTNELATIIKNNIHDWYTAFEENT